ncbi:MAG TPA: protein kinase [Thermoanaerobaculia bacterium]
MTALPEIESRFEVLAKLGEGGMGCVYKVRHRDLDELQIVKTLQAHLSTNESLRTRFINEARRGMKLRHPHIAGVHDFHVGADGTGYIVMEYVHGLNLRDVLAARGPLPVAMVGDIAVQTLDALAYLHDERFVHRDISPDNIMLMTSPDGRSFIKLIDLGIAKSLEAGDTMTATGQFIGKVSYASPEQFGGDLDHRSDLYSLGVVLYKLLTNADPFVGADYREVIAAQLFKPPRRFDDVAPNLHISEAVQQVIFRALEKEPAARYANATEFGEAVQQAFGVTASRQSPRTLPAATVVTGDTAADATQVSGTLAAPTLPDQTQVSGTAKAAAPTVLERRPFAHARSLAIALLTLIVLGAAAALWWQERASPAAAPQQKAGVVPAAAATSYGRFYAVVIGESQYQRFESLPTPVNDARAVAQVLENDYGFTVTRLENATGQEIVGALRTAAQKLTAADNLLIYYAGHGELLGEKGWWKPVDADFERTNWVSSSMIDDVLRDNPAALRILIVADSCYAGALAHGIDAETAAGAGRLAKRSRMVISSGGVAPIIDSADGEHSIFTRALLEVLRDPNRKTTDVQTLFAATKARVIDAATRAGYPQRPQLAVIAGVGDEGGTFYFVPRR